MRHRWAGMIVSAALVGFAPFASQAAKGDAPPATPAPERRGEGRPELGGRVTAVGADGKSFTVESRGRAERGAAPNPEVAEIKITDSTQVVFWNVESDGAKPTIGYEAMVFLAEGSKDIAARVRFMGQNEEARPQLYGRVTAVSDDGKRLTLATRGDGAAATIDIKLTDRTHALYAGVTTGGAKPTIGYSATVWLEPGSKETAARIRFNRETNARAIGVTGDGARRPVADRPAGDRPRGDREIAGRPVGDRLVGDRPAADRPAGDRPAGDRPVGDRPRGDRPAVDRPVGDRPAVDRPVGDRRVGDRPVGDRRVGDRPVGDRPVGDRPLSDRPLGDRPLGDRPLGDRPLGDRPLGDRPLGDRRAGDRPAGDRPAAERGGDWPEAARTVARAPERGPMPDTTSPQSPSWYYTRGAVDKVDGTSLIVKDPRDASTPGAPITTDAATAVSIGGKPAKLSDLPPGSRVRVMRDIHTNTAIRIEVLDPGDVE